MLDWLSDILIVLGLIAIGWAIWGLFGAHAVVGYAGAILVIAGALLLRRRMVSQ